MAKQHKPRVQKKKKFDVVYEKVLNIILIACAAAVALYLLYLGGSALVDALHLDGSLRIADSAVVAEDGWLVKNTGTASKPKCFKYGELGEIEGYVREKSVTSAYERGYTYVPEEGTDGVKSITVSVAADFDTNPQNALDIYSGLYEGIEVSGLQSEKTPGGQDATYFTYAYPDPESGLTVSGVCYYIKAGDRSVFIYVIDRNGADVRAALDSVIAALKITR